MKIWFKKAVAFAALVSIILVAAGCTRKSPRELLLSAVQKSGTIISNKTSGEARVELSGREAGTAPQEIVKISFDGAFQKKPDIGSVKMNASVGGFGFDIDAYSKDGKTWIKLPVVPAYILLDPKDLAEQAGIKYDAAKQKELEKKFGQRLFTEYVNSIPEDMMALEQNRKTPDGVQVDTVVLNLDRETIDGFMDTFLEISAEPEFQGLYLPVFGTPAGQILGLPQAKDLKEIIRDLRGRVKVEKLDMRLGIDKSGYIRHWEINAKYEVAPKGELNIKPATYDIYALIKTDDINSKQDINLPDLDKLEVIK